MHKPRRKELVVEILRKGYSNLLQIHQATQCGSPSEEQLLHQAYGRRFLEVAHRLEETNETIAFAVEPLFGSLANITGKMRC